MSVQATLPVPTMTMLGLDQSNPFQVAGYMVASDLYVTGHIPKFDPSIIMLIIEILTAILPLIQEYCPAESSAVATNAANLGPVQRWRWMATIRARALRSVGRRGWLDVGDYAFADTVIKATAENKEDIVGKLLLVCG